MKLLSFRYAGEERFGPKVKKEEAVWDLIAIQQQLEVLPAFPASLIEGIPQGMEFVEAIRKLTEAAVQSDRSEEFKHSFSEIEWLPPISKTPKNILCVGKNYADHAKEMGAEAPVDLVVFTKAPATISADGATVSVHSDLTDSYDYEGELITVLDVLMSSSAKPGIRYRSKWLMTTYLATQSPMT